jgi:Protein of unknown function (Hypoth_ymh)
MEATKNPEYLRGTAEAVAAFRQALEYFLSLQEVNLTMARGILPAVFPREGIDAETLTAATSAVDQAAGRASGAAALTGRVIAVQGAGVLDPIAAWHTITKPKPLLEPDDILSACGQMTGVLEAMIRKANAELPPKIGAEAMHPLIWGAAKGLWRDGHHRQAVAAASETLIAQVKFRTGRNDIPETALWQDAFSERAPEPGKPRLRWPGEPKNRDVKAMNDGLRQFAPGAQMTIRNGAVHGNSDMAEQDALERLAVLSLLARWVEECDLIQVPNGS